MRIRGLGARGALTPMVVAVATAALTTAGFSASAAVAADGTPAPLVRARTAEVVPGSYLVVLKKSASQASVKAAAKRSGGSVGTTFRHALSGYTAELSAAELAKVRKDPAVAYVERNAVYPRSVLGAEGAPTRSTTETARSWGLDRVDQRTLPLTRTYFYEGSRVGAGVDVYVIDDGVRPTHTDFRDAAGASRVATGVNTTDDGQGMSTCPTADADYWGHGTHVAGTLAGRLHGVARAATVVPVKVFPCPTADNPEGNTTLAAIITGVDWAVADHAAGAPAVANLSLGGGVSPSFDAAINRLIADGVTTVVAAGNSDPNLANQSYDSCNYSPARVPAAITVAATGTNDTRASYSFYGSCVDIFAPGNGITSASFLSDTGTSVKSGTSMAAPHVAGVAATYLGAHPGDTPAQVRAAIVGASTLSQVRSAGTGSPNRLLWSPLADPPPANAAANRLTSGAGLLAGKSIKSPNGLYTLTQQGDGNLVLTKPGGRVLWATNRKGSWTRMGTNGNLVQFDYARSVWSSGVTGGPAELRLQDDANLVTYRAADNAATWASRTTQRLAPPQVAAGTDTVAQGRALYRGGRGITSSDGRYTAYVRASSGALVVRRVGGTSDLWWSGAKDDDWLSVQGDGNAVLYRSNGNAVWSTGTGGSGSGAARLVMQNDGNLVLYRGSRALWSSKGGRL